MDFGFAPNPFDGYCTLATCKAKIRNKAEVGDWVLGTGSKENVGHCKLIYIMEVTEILTFDEYWNDERFIIKRPNMDGSIKARSGDNIYYSDNDGWHQIDSRHSNIEGENTKNKDGDLKSKNVLISENFYYYGDESIEIPIDFLNDPNICVAGFPGHKCKFPDEFISEFIKWVKSNLKKGINGFPSQFGNYERHIPR